MIIEGKNIETNETIKVDVKDFDINKLKDFTPASDKPTLLNAIDNLAVSAEIKVILGKMMETTLKIGKTIYQIGQKIVEMVIYFVKKYPSTILGLVIGTVIGLIIDSIPVIGWLVGWVITPLCIAFGLIVGFYADMNEQSLKNEISRSINEVFEGLKSVPTTAS
jgi:hypothetical protein